MNDVVKSGYDFVSKITTKTKYGFVNSVTWMVGEIQLGGWIFDAGKAEDGSIVYKISMNWMKGKNGVFCNDRKTINLIQDQLYPKGTIIAENELKIDEESGFTL